MQNLIELALQIGILVIILFIFVLLLAAIVRRLLHSRQYEKLDRLRDFSRGKLVDLMQSEEVFQKISDFRSRPKSIKWQAIEHVLLDLIHEEQYRENVRKLFDELGYIHYYERKLKSANVITRASAIDKLGKMQSVSSADKLVYMLDSKDIEIVSVAVRSLSRIGCMEGLKGILERFPELLQKSLVARKTTEVFLLNFGPRAVPVLTDHARKTDIPGIKASLLEVLSQMRDKEALPLAIQNLKNENAEVRAKALKVIATTAVDVESFDWEEVVPLASDPVWFVRLHASRALGNKKYKKAANVLAGLLFDESWHVRNAGAMALTQMGDTCLDIFLDVLRSSDPYVKGSVCEELQKTNYVNNLIENLSSDDTDIYTKSSEILDIMYSMNFRTPFIRYMDKGEDNRIKEKIEGILEKESER